MRLCISRVFVLALLLAACSSSVDGEQTGAEGDPQDAEGTSEVEVVEDEGEPDWTGAPLNPFDLALGQCFNEVSWIDTDQDRRINITATIDCGQPHDKEVYHQAEFPAPNGAPFPGEDAMTSWSTELCYAEFAGFVGEEYELSTYGIDFLQPTQETFEHPIGRHRRVMCFVYDTSGEQLLGSARSSQV